jgi:hypothetical protein
MAQKDISIIIIGTADDATAIFPVAPSLAGV